MCVSLLLSELLCMLQGFHSSVLVKNTTVLKPGCNFMKITTANRIRKKGKRSDEVT